MGTRGIFGRIGRGSAALLRRGGMRIVFRGEVARRGVVVAGTRPVGGMVGVHFAAACVAVVVDVDCGG